VDPFSPEADPRHADAQDEARVGRRTLLLTLAVVPVGAAACTQVAPACPTLPQDAGRCPHRFCRYSRG
jgi:hypothetical protein